MPWYRIAVFLSVILSLTAGVHRFLWVRLVRDPWLPEPWFKITTWILVALAISIPLGMIATRAMPRSLLSPLMWAVYTWMGVLFFLLILLLPVELTRAVARVVFGQDLPTDPERRLMFSRVMSALVGTGAMALSGAGIAAIVRPVPIKSVRVPIARLSKKLSGYTIVQLTDVHVGPTIGREFIEKLVAQTNALSPDLVAITGDLVDGSVEELRDHVEPLRHIKARDGVYFVTGNHEYYSGVDEWLEHVRSLGIRVLRNERVPIRDSEGEHGFDLAGVDDYTAHQFGSGHGMDVEKACAGRDPMRALVLLAHQPKAINAAAKAGVDLQISGHTHGGQLFPFNFAVKLQQPYVDGLHKHGDSHIYVSRGTGYWGPPMRLGAPAEITKIELYTSV